MCRLTSAFPAHGDGRPERTLRHSRGRRLPADRGRRSRHLGGRFTGTPHVGYGVSYGVREIGVGWRLAPEAEPGVLDLSVAVQATRREGVLETADHRIGIEVRAR